MMRLTYICPSCSTTVRREMTSGKDGNPQGGIVKCPKGHGAMSREDKQDWVVVCGLTIYDRKKRKKRSVGHCRLPPKHEGMCQRLSK